MISTSTTRTLASLAAVLILPSCTTSARPASGVAPEPEASDLAPRAATSAPRAATSAPQATTPGYLGCRVGKLEPDEETRLSTALGRQATGAKVLQTLPDSPAADADLRPGDIVFAFDGTPLADSQALVQRSLDRGAGATVELSVWRAGKRHTTRLTLAENPFKDREQLDTSPGLSRVQIHKDLAYYQGDDADARKHKLDLYVPVSDKPVPVIMWIHAGGWSVGDRSGEVALASRLAERGVAVAAISHRASAGSWIDPKLPDTGVVHPEHAVDAARAFAWLRANVGRYGGDPRRIFTSGHSSGAHLATLIATNPRYLSAHGLSVDAVAGAIPIEGTYDIAHYYEVLTAGLGQDKADAHVHAVFGAKPDGWKDASPSHFLQGNSVPMLVVTGEEEAFGKYADRLREAAQAQGKQNVRFYDAKDRVHATIILLMTRRTPDPVRREILDFVRTGRPAGNV